MFKDSDDTAADALLERQSIDRQHNGSLVMDVVASVSNAPTRVVVRPTAYPPHVGIREI